jgi:hypothetical protein
LPADLDDILLKTRINIPKTKISTFRQEELHTMRDSDENQLLCGGIDDLNDLLAKHVTVL